MDEIKEEQRKDGGLTRWGGRKREQVKEGVAINSMTHSFCGGYFLTAFIKANLIILAR